jgi:DNA replication protein DnaC
LTRTLDELDARLAWAARERPGPTALLEHVLCAEAAHKLEQRVARRIDTSGLVERKTLEAFDWDFQSSLDKDLVLELARLDFVRRHDDLVITGDHGTGKSHLLKAFALRACEQGIRMRYARCVDLLDDLHAGLYRVYDVAA